MACFDMDPYIGDISRHRDLLAEGLYRTRKRLWPRCNDGLPEEESKRHRVSPAGHLCLWIRSADPLWKEVSSSQKNFCARIC